MKQLTVLLMSLISLVLVGCDTSSDNVGSLSLDITDAPVTNVKKVVVKISAVALKGNEEEQNLEFTFDEPMSIDLLTLQGTDTKSLFTNKTVPAGVYTEIRLIVEQDEALDTYLEFNDGAVEELTVPSGSQSGLKVKGDFTVPVGGSANFTIDFDVLKSVVEAGNSGKYNLKPVLRLVNNVEVGVIKGVVDFVLINDATCTAEEADAVYVFTGNDVIPDDIDVTDSSDGVEPITTALVKLNDVTGDFEYSAAFLPAGDYTVSFSCHADAEDIEVDTDDLSFSTGINASVVAGETTVVSFQ